MLCSNIEKVDNSIWDNISIENEQDIDIYQYYLCNLSEYEKEELVNYGIIISYSNLLNLDVIMVDHYGTSWDYVMTDVKWIENI